MRTVDCPSCGAHFALPEELYERKVAGKKTNVRCKVCGERVLLDGTRGAAAEDLWVVSVDEEDRELSTSQVAEAIKSGEIDTNAIVWKEGMDDWATLDRVEHFAPVLADSPSAGVADSPRLVEPSPVAAQHPTAEPDRVDAPAGAQTAEKEGAGAAQSTATNPAPTPEKNLDLHALFSVDSAPPSSTHLRDSDLQSLPPSVLPSLDKLRRLPAIPKAPRAFDDDLLGMANERGVVIAPPSLGSLLVATPDPADAELASAEIDTPAEEDLLEEPTALRVPGETQSVASSRSGRLVLRYGVALGGLAAVVGLLLAYSSLRGSGVPASAEDDPTRHAAGPAPIDSNESAAVAGAGESSPEQRPDTPSDDAVQRPGPRPKRVQNPPSAAAQASPRKRSTVVSGGHDAEPTGASPGPPTPATANAPNAKAPDSQAPDSSERASASNAGFDKGAALAALTAAASAASSCRRGADPSGTAVVLVTFAPSGRVTSANLSGPPFAGTPTGGCIAAQMRAARVPAYTGGYVTVSKRVVIH